MDAALKAKRDLLVDLLKEMGGCVIGFSGGVDSTFLFAIAVEVLGERALAVTATSETYPLDRKSTRLNSSHNPAPRMPSSA
jgi:uncharacterized protein